MTFLERLLRPVHAQLACFGVGPGSKIVLAYSGGVDSTALLVLARALAEIVPFQFEALHVDHRLDPDSGRRSRIAVANARTLGVKVTVKHLDPDAIHRHPNGLEAGARVLRYDLLEQHAKGCGADFVATAHHLDDQAETVLLRMAAGSGLRGVGGIAPHWQPVPSTVGTLAIDESRARVPVIRPLLELPRRDLERVVREADLSACDDPTNRARDRPRSRVRHDLLPALTTHQPTLTTHLARLADTVRRVFTRIDKRLEQALQPRPTRSGLGVVVSRAAFDAMPPALLPSALAVLHRHAGVPYPASRAARAELIRQIQNGDRVGCDCGSGWRWEGDKRTLRLVPRVPSRPGFAYTVGVPGVALIEALGLLIQIERRDVAPWMYQASPWRAAFVARDLPESCMVIRNRQPGDRVRPLGAPGERRLKDVLIDKRYPRHLRDQIPLLCLANRIVWIPGVAIAHRFRIRDEQRVWVAQLTTADPPSP